MNADKEILKQSKKEIIYNIFTSVFTRLTVLIMPIFWSKVITNVTNSNFNDAYFYVFLCLVDIVLYWFSEYINQVAIYKLYNKIYSKLTSRAINGISHNSLFSLSRFSLSEYSNILNSDVDIIAGYYTNYIARIIRIIEMFVIYFYFFSINFYMFLVVVIVSLIGLVLFYIARKKTSKNNLDRKQNLDLKTNYNHEFFLGIRDIKSFNLFGKISNRLFKGTEEYLTSNAKYNINFNGDKFFIVCFIEIFKYLLMFYGVYLIGIDLLDIGILVVIYNYYAKLVDNFGIISTLNVEKCNLLVSKNRYNKIFEHVTYDEETIVKKRKFEGKIEFRNILYGYKDDPTLNNVSFVIEPNTFNSIIGKDDSGYQGVYELLLKMNRQHCGTIMVDDIDIKDIQNVTYYNTISLLTPNPFFFNLSIKDNLLIVSKNFEEVINLCKTLDIHDMINSLPNGYDTIINDTLTKELKNMLAIVRTLVKDSKIILIADTLFELNQNNFKKVTKYLKKLSSDHTIIILGRELDTCDMSDKIIVFDQGEVKEIGNHNELINNKGFYYNNFYNYGNEKEK